jgi:hypothetical protein
MLFVKLTSDSAVLVSLIEAPQHMLRTHRSLDAYSATLCWRLFWFFFLFRVMEHRWNETEKENSLTRGKPVLVPNCPPQIPHRVILNRTRSSAVRVQRLSAWAMARPSEVPFHQRESSGFSSLMKVSTQTVLKKLVLLHFHSNPQIKIKSTFTRARQCSNTHGTWVTAGVTWGLW